MRVGIPHTHICGGSARCSTCRILIVEGLEFCSPRTSLEAELAKKLQLEPEIRLACQTQVASGKVILRRLAIVNRRVLVQIPGKSGEYPLYEVVGMPPLPIAIEEIAQLKKNFYFSSFAQEMDGFVCWGAKLDEKIFL